MITATKSYFGLRTLYVVAICIIKMQACYIINQLAN